ncbi:MAG: transposase [Chloroflexi bacterium]|nr:transposase [Chloroflexota bacterium]
MRSQCTNSRAGRRAFQSVYQPYYAEADRLQAGPGSRLTRIRRKTTVETVFADTKTRHGLSRARYRGLRKFSAQAFLSATAYNLKKYLKHERMVADGAMALALPSTILPAAPHRLPRRCYSPC